MTEKRSKARVKGTTAIAGVVGWPIKHSMSPVMQNAAFEKHGLDVIYVPFGIPEDGLKPLLTTLKKINAIGINVTIPHKEAIMPLLDRIDSRAKKIGAVNTVVFANGQAKGYNTDATGFITCVNKRVKIEGKSAVLLGGGGAGRAIAMTLVLNGVKKLCVVDKDRARLKKLLLDLKKLKKSCQLAAAGPGTEVLFDTIKDCDLLVNATPLGLKTTDPLPLEKARIPKNKCVMDIVYGKGLTPFLKAARSKGNKIIPGWEMLLYQGADAYQLWTKRKAPVAVMEQALLKAAGIKK